MAHRDWRTENEIIGLSQLLEEATEHLQRLADWGWGENAPDLARVQWGEAREFLASEKLREARI